jgi:predicted RNA-binding Zn ribbon-like protein
MMQMEPGGRAPAPEPVRLVQLFVNSYDDLTKTETMGSPEELGLWLKRRRLPPGSAPLRPGDIRRLHAVREAIRAVLARHNDGPPPSRATLALLRDEGRRACIRTTFSDAGEPMLAEAGEGVPGLLASVFRAAVAAAERGMWKRLKACPECGWVFYDHSRNRRGSWCTMAICGSRAKMRAYRRRGGYRPSNA